MPPPSILQGGKMISRILSVLLSAVILLTATLPAHAVACSGAVSGVPLLRRDAALRPAGRDRTSWTATSCCMTWRPAPSRLTDDGLAMLPAWSPDGRYVTYSSGRDFDLPTCTSSTSASGESCCWRGRLCCATWAARRRCASSSWQLAATQCTPTRSTPHMQTFHVLSTVHIVPHLSGHDCVGLRTSTMP